MKLVLINKTNPSKSPCCLATWDRDMNKWIEQDSLGEDVLDTLSMLGWSRTSDARYSSSLPDLSIEVEYDY